MSGDSLAETQPLPLLPARKRDGHKGTFGTVLVIGGSCIGHTRMIGAPAFAAIAALRSGVGLVRLACPAPIIETVMAHCPSATGLALPTRTTGEIVSHEAARILDDGLDSANAVVLGPGLGGGDEVEAMVLRVMAQDRVPVVVDADALNAMSNIPSAWESVRAPCVLTPHPGEFSRLAEQLCISHDPSSPTQRPQAAEEMAQRTGTVVVLKGSRTIVSDGHRHWRSESSCPALATGGTGDVLAGLLGGLVARLVPRFRPELTALPESVRAKVPADPDRPLDLYDCARIAVDVHASCGTHWSRSRNADGGMLAVELAGFIPAEVAAREA